MRVLVGVKRVVDYAVRVRALPDGSGPDVASAKRSMNPFCEIALEAGVRLREAGAAAEVVAVSVGGKDAADTLRVALAMGADRAVHAEVAGDVEPRGVAKVLRAVAGREDAALVLLGKQAVDGDCNQTGQMLAGMLGWPQVGFWVSFLSAVPARDDDAKPPFTTVI